MERRSFLLGAASTLAVSQLAAGCSGQNQSKLRVQVLKGSIPAQLVKEFRQSLEQSSVLEFTSVEQLKDLFAELQIWRQQKSPKVDDKRWVIPFPLIHPRPSAVTDLVTMGDYWLASAIQQKLIQPLDIAQLKQWQHLPKRWQELVRRDDQGQLDAQGKVWAAPYRWGSTVIAYNRDKFQSLGWIPSDWSDLWRPELRDRISLLDQPREVIGLTLKKLGHSYNTEHLDIPVLARELRGLSQQVKFYSSNNYLQPLLMGDTWLAVGWSSDVLPIVQKNDQIRAVVPHAGTAMWTDLWVHPASAVNGALKGPLLEQWIDFCWQPKIQEQISLLSKATSVIPTDLGLADIQAELRSLLLSDPQTFQRNEFLLPLPKATIQQYASLWKAIRY